MDSEKSFEEESYEQHAGHYCQFGLGGGNVKPMPKHGWRKTRLMRGVIYACIKHLTPY